MSTNRGYPPVGTYVRHEKTGDLARIVEKDGNLWIKPDLPGSPVHYPISLLHNWRIEEHARRLPPGHFARVSYEAWRTFCDVHPELKRQKEWMSLHPEVKAKWIRGEWKFATRAEELLVKGVEMILKENVE